MDDKIRDKIIEYWWLTDNINFVHSRMLGRDGKQRKEINEIFESMSKRREKLENEITEILQKPRRVWALFDIDGYELCRISTLYKPNSNDSKIEESINALLLAIKKTTDAIVIY